MDQYLDQLNQQFGIPGLAFQRVKGDFVRAVIDCAAAVGEVYLHGAHVTSYQPCGYEPVLWMSEKSYFESGKPIRGGVPICFPWFGPHASNSEAPAHGLTRTAIWEVTSTSRMAGGGIAIELSTVCDGFYLRYRAEFGRSLTLSVTTRLASNESQPKRFEEALHTYFSVSDIHEIIVEGLESYAYLDKVGGVQQFSATHAPIQFVGETDRIYLDTNAICKITDPKSARVITLRQSNSRSTIVWNPWIAKSARMPDFGDHEWPGMVCIETANVGNQAIFIGPGELHTLVAQIEVT